MSSSPPNTQHPILDPEDLANLEREGTVVKIPNSSARRIHKRRLNRSSEEEYKNTQLPSPPSSVASPPSTAILAQDYQLIPEFLICRDTLSFLGFDLATANEIWSRWANWGSDGGREIDGGPVTFQSMATEWIRSSNTDAFTEDDNDWQEAMTACGINEPLKTAIMMPFYKDVRLTASCKYWLIDTIKSRYESLGEIQATSKERVRAARRAELRPGGGLQRQSNIRSGQQSGARSISSTFSTMPGVSSVHISAPEVHADAPGYTVLYKGARIIRLQAAFDTYSYMTEPQHLVTSGAGDFNSFGFNSIYMVLDFEVAKKYAAWAKRRDTNQCAGILRLEVPNAAIESLTAPAKMTLHWPSQRWKELVWTCRRGTRLRGQMAQVRNSTLMIGTICSKPNGIIAGLPSADHITERMLLRTSSGHHAVQYAFTVDVGGDFLADNCSKTSRIYTLAAEDLAIVEGGDQDSGSG